LLLLLLLLLLSSLLPALLLLLLLALLWLLLPALLSLLDDMVDGIRFGWNGLVVGGGVGVMEVEDERGRRNIIKLGGNLK
jgi:hypothetical protein